MSKISSIIHHIISDATKKLQEQTKNQIKKLNLSIGSRQKVQSIQEFKQSNEKAQLKIQQSLKYLAEFKKRVYQMRNQISKNIIYRYCFLLLKIFDLDSFIENKLRRLQKDNSRRFLGKIEISNNKGMYKGEAENGFPEGRGVFKYPDGAVYDGEFKGGQPEGRGVYKYPDGAVYDGEFKGGLSQKAEEFISFLLVLFMMENLKVGSQKAEEFLSILTVLFMMENLKVGSQKAEEFISILTVLFMMENLKVGLQEGRGVYKYPSGAVYDGEFKGGLRRRQRSL